MKTEEPKRPTADICDDLKIISNRVLDSEKAVLALSNRIRATITNIFIETKQKELREAGHDRTFVNEKLLECRKDKDFKELMGDLRDEMVAQLSKMSVEKVGAEAGRLWGKYPEIKDVAYPAVIGFLYGIQAAERQKDMDVKQLREKVRELPVWKAWAKEAFGIGELTVGHLAGQCNDLCNFPKVEKLYKFLGLGVFNGHAQGKIKGMKICGDAAKGQFYSPPLLSKMLLMGKNLMKCAGKRPDAPYAQLYRLKHAEYKAEAEVENEKQNRLMDAEGIPEGKDRWKTGRLISYGTVTMRAERWITKRMIKDLYRAWWICEGRSDAMFPNPELSPLLIGQVA